MARIFITGVAGFVGFLVASRLSADGHEVRGLDNLSPYYDVELKLARLAKLERDFGFVPQIADLADSEAIKSILRNVEPEFVIHLAAQPGVRHSISDPQSYVTSNLVGHANLLEACRETPPRHLLYASSSSVYGANRSLPFRETDPTDRPVSLYAATKRANEAMSHSYSHLYGIPATGLRFFTVYGEWGRPDMAPYLFATAILNGAQIDLFNRGQIARDFTYGPDAAEAVARLLTAVPQPSIDCSARHRVVNVASGRKVPVTAFIAALEESLGRAADINLLPMQPGDVEETWADISLLRQITGYVPQTDLSKGVEQFAYWFSDQWQRGAIGSDASLAGLPAHQRAGGVQA